MPPVIAALPAIAQGVSIAGGIAGIAGSLKGGGSSQTTQSTQLPKWVDQAAKQNLSDARSVTAKPYQPYVGEAVAPLTEQQQYAQYLSGQGAGVGSGALGSAYSSFSDADAYARQMVGAGSGYIGQGGAYGAEAAAPITSEQIANYMNPYVSMALSPVERELNEARDRTRLQQNAAAGPLGALGGARQGIEYGQTEEKWMQQLQDLYKGGFGDAYNQAFGAVGDDKNRQLQAGNLFNNLGISSSNLASSDMNRLMEGGRGMSGMAGQEVGMYDAAIKRLLATGGLEQGVNQAQDSFDYSQFLEGRDWDEHNLQLNQDALASSPYGQTVTRTEPGADRAGQLAGLGLSAASLFGNGGIFDQGGNSTVSMNQGTVPLIQAPTNLSGLVDNPNSDIKLKEDITEIGTVESLNIPLYSFRYIEGDGGLYEGVMAQDLLEVMPDAVSVNNNGFMSVNYGKINELEGREVFKRIR